MTSTELMNIGAFENVRPDGAFAALNPDAESLSDGIGQSYAIIGFKGKTWSLRKNGETHLFRRPEDGYKAPFLDVIILRSPSYKSKTWYEGGYVEGQSAGKRPDCGSVHGDRPDADSLKPQAQACQLCPHNEFKTAPNGRKGKACSDTKRLAVLIIPNQTKPLFGGEPLIEPALLRIPPASLNDLAALGSAMERKGFHYSTYITRIGFDETQAHPKMTFQAMPGLTAKEAPTILALREDATSYRITGERDVDLHGAKPLAASARAAIEQQSVVETGFAGAGVRAAANETAPKAAPLLELAAAPAEDEVTILKRKLAELEAKALKPKPTLVEVAPSNRGPASTQSSTTVLPSGQMTAPEDSDAELDDLVSKLLPR